MYSSSNLLTYVALGDSYSSGEGIGSPYRGCGTDTSEVVCTDNFAPYAANGNECRRHSSAYSTATPGATEVANNADDAILASSEFDEFDVGRHFYACSGAIAADVTGPCPRRVELVLHYDGSSRTLNPSADAYVANGTVNIYDDPTMNYGDDVELAVGYEGAVPFRSFIQFDLSDVLGSPTAELRVRHSGCTGCDNSNAVTVYHMTDSWIESGNTGITWDNSVSDVGAPIDSKTFSAVAGKWISFNVTQAVRDWLDGSKPNYGFVLASGPGSALSWLHSEEAAGTDNDEEACEWQAPDDIQQRHRPMVDTADLLTITIGGNDVGFREIVTKCLGPSFLQCENRNPPGDSEDHATLREWVDWQLDDLFERLRDVYRGINDLTGNKPLLVPGYAGIRDQPHPDECYYYGPLAFSSSDVEFLDWVAREINERAKCAAAYENVGFVDIDSGFKGKLCNVYGEDPAVNGLRLVKVETNGIKDRLFRVFSGQE